jgi:hypothetical protein
MGRYLPLFLEWLPRQTCFEQLEIVLDHNEPTTEEISQVQTFQTRYPGRIRHLIQPKVDPIGTSMNRCIREATAPFVAIWNVDDLRTPESLQKQVEVLSKDDQLGIVYGDYWVVSSFGSTQGKLIGHSRIPDDELTRSMIFGPFYMFRKSLVQRAGYFDEQLRTAADFDLAVRLALNARAFLCPVPLGYYLNEGLGSSTRPDSIQPGERTAIKLRYGVYDKINYAHVPEAVRYVIPSMSWGGEWHKVSDYVPAYDQLLKSRYAQWHTRGLVRSSIWTLWDRSAVARAIRWLRHKIAGGTLHQSSRRA